MRHETEPRSTDTAQSAGHPTRAAERNRDLVDRDESASEGGLLPSLDDGITLLDVAEGRGVSVLQALVLDHLLLNEGPAFWVDADGHATTTRLARLAPSQRLLDRVHVARGFTPYQHYSAVCDLSEEVNRQIRAAASGPDRSGARAAASPRTPSLVVAPAFDAQYRAADTLSKPHARTLQTRAIARLRACADAYDVPVLVTRTATDAFTGPIETAAERRLQCERTRLGPRFVGEEFETLVYPVAEDTYQTTFAYWRQVLGIRAEQVGLEPSAAPEWDAAATPVGTGVTATGETATLVADPLLDARGGSGDAGGQ
ncbi:hypothetical protein [Halobellus litoreus]|uniref:Uncharacterized protein n=1 Tax=Halobellus litoreus TaxID=755310 RepID=A0ABD6DUW8_9EURY|nr:hypothetical protein [Halobellus litoreus]